MLHEVEFLRTCASQNGSEGLEGTSVALSFSQSSPVQPAIPNNPQNSRRKRATWPVDDESSSTGRKFRVRHPINTGKRFRRILPPHSTSMPRCIALLTIDNPITCQWAIVLPFDLYFSLQIVRHLRRLFINRCGSINL